MARKRQATDLNLDSLMDALTNVVGILVIILVLTSLDVSSAVNRIKRVRPQDFVITERDVEQARAELGKQRKLLASLQQTAGFDPDLAKLADIQKQIEELKALLAMDPDAPLEEVLELIKQLSKTKVERGENLIARQDRRQDLKALLEETPERTAPQAKVVRVPNPRAAPKSMKPVMFFCRGQNVLLMAPDTLQEKAVKRAEYVLRPLLNRAGPDGEIDGDTFVAEFNKARLTDANFRATLVISNYSPYLVFKYQGGGESVEKFSTRTSKYQVALRRLDAETQYAQFLVWSDSFDAYVEARRICDEYDLAAGWRPYDTNYEWRTPLGISVKIKGKPKPRPRKPRPPGEEPPPPPKPLPDDQID